LCILPVEDGNQIKAQRHEPNCEKEVNKLTIHLKFEIKDETGKVVNYWGTRGFNKFSL
jgi:hypothetical protein